MAISLGICSCITRFPEKVLSNSCWRKNSCLASFWQLGGEERRSSYSICKLTSVSCFSPVLSSSTILVLESSSQARTRGKEREKWWKGRLYLNRLSTISCIVSPVFILISRNAHAANSWAVSEFQDINQVISWLSSCIAEDLAFSLLQS